MKRLSQLISDISIGLGNDNQAITADGNFSNRHYYGSSIGGLLAVAFDLTNQCQAFSRGGNINAFFGEILKISLGTKRSKYYYYCGTPLNSGFLVLL